MSDTRLLVVHARSPLHAGTGQSTAAVDLPIARDRATSHPLLPGSSIKGSLRAVCRSQDADRTVGLFGPETENASDHAGALAFGDARLVLLPVRSLGGTFAWVSCPWALAVLQRDAALCGLDLPAPPALTDGERAWVPPNSLLPVTVTVDKKRAVVLEEHDLKVEERPEAEAWAKALGTLFHPDWAQLLAKRLCLVSDDVFTFLAKHGTDVVTRVRIDPDTGTAKDGQLWTEENLPTEAILVGPVQATPWGRDKAKAPRALFDELQGLLARPVQLGGKATVGRGRCDLRLVGG